MTRTINGTFRTFLKTIIEQPGVAIHIPGDTDEPLALPYLLISSTTDEELIPRNHTWIFSLSVEWRTSADDHDGEEARCFSADLFRRLAESRSAINALAPSFYLYSISLASLDEASVEERCFCYRATFRLVAQF